MKKIIIILTALSTSFNLISQTDSTKNEEDVEINIGDKTIVIKSNPNSNTELNIKTNENGKDCDNKKKHPYLNYSFSVDIGVSGLLYKKNSTVDANPISNVSTDLNYVKSRNYGLNLQFAFNLTKNFGILTGFGYHVNRYSFKNNLTIDPNKGNFTADTINEYNYFKFKNYYSQIPLMLTFQSSNQKFQFAAGGILGYNIKSYVKYEYVEGNVEYKSEITGNHNINPLKLSLGARLNYNNIGIYFNYALSNLNENTYSGTTENFDLMPFSAGITFGGF